MLVGLLVGLLVDLLVGLLVGSLVGLLVGLLVCLLVGLLVDVLVGVLVGLLVGVLVGIVVGLLVGLLPGNHRNRPSDRPGDLHLPRNFRATSAKLPRKFGTKFPDPFDHSATTSRHRPLCGQCRVVVSMWQLSGRQVVAKWSPSPAGKAWPMPNKGLLDPIWQPYARDLKKTSAGSSADLPRIFREPTCLQFKKSPAPPCADLPRIFRAARGVHITKNE